MTSGPTLSRGVHPRTVKAPPFRLARALVGGLPITATIMLGSDLNVAILVAWPCLSPRARTFPRSC